MSKAEAFEAKFAGNRSINVEVNFSKGDAIKVPVNINSMDADKLAQNIAEKLDLSSVESKVEEVGNKIDNIKLPEIDTTDIASKDLEKFFGVKPIDGYEFMTPEEVCSTLEEIMTTMDIDLTPEQAKEITNNTLNKG